MKVLNLLLLMEGSVIAVAGLMLYLFPAYAAWQCATGGYICAVGLQQLVHPQILVLIPIGLVSVAYSFRHAVRQWTDVPGNGTF
jgi:uncharacterized membrane protein YesL